MIRNELKDLLPEGWEKEFKHREDWDPTGYSVAAFKLNEKDKREIVLAKFDETDDIMDYFFDDKSEDYETDLNFAIRHILGKENDLGYKINKSYIILGKYFKKKSLSDEIVESGDVDFYPRIILCKTLMRIHRLIAFIFVPNPHPDKFDIVNHKDKNKTNFRKENLEWCDLKWNSKKENQKPYKPINFYLRKSDNKLFTSTELSKEYGVKQHSATSMIRNSVNLNKPYKGSLWDIIKTTLAEYLSKHKLREDWYDHPTLQDVRANGCGVLEINGRLKVGSLNNGGTKGHYVYNIGINNKTYRTHRILAECFLGRELAEDEVVDHIIPISEKDINNSKENLRVGSQKDNMNNKTTVINLSKKFMLYDIFGNLIKKYNTGNEALSDLKMSLKTNRTLILKNKYIFISENDNVESKLKYVYYKFRVDENNDKVCLGFSQFLGSLSDNKEFDCHISSKLRKYLNTGMPAPDGYYYQQGTPKEMIYDPENTKLEKKRPEIHWKDRNKEEKE